MYASCYNECPNRTQLRIAEAKEQLKSLNKELLFNFTELLDCLAVRPSEYARYLENVGDILRTIMGITSSLRPFQARYYRLSALLFTIVLNNLYSRAL